MDVDAGMSVMVVVMTLIIFCEFSFLTCFFFFYSFLAFYLFALFFLLIFVFAVVNL